MNIFLTGGTGYLGSALISKLTGEREISRIVALIRNPEKAIELSRNVKLCEKLQFVYGDLRYHSFDFGNIDVVIHAAAVVDADSVERNIAEAIDVNVGGTHRLLEAVWRSKIRRLIFFSSHSVYMNQDTILVSEDFVPTPNIPKAMTKYAGEVIVRSLTNSSTKFVILRPAHIYGIGVLPRWNDYTAKFARLSCIGEPLPIYGDGNQKVDLVHISDVCNCIYRFLISSQSIWNETYNIGGGRPLSINELTDLYVKAAVEMGLKAPTKSYVKIRSYTQTRGIRLPCLDISKLQAKLGWAPSTSIEEGVKEIIRAKLAGDMQGLDQSG